MKLLVTFLSISILSLNSFAHLSFEQEVDFHHEYYEVFGDDNNWIQKKVFEDSFEEFFKNKKIVEIKMTEKENLFSSIKECIYFPSGAYGDHLSNWEQIQLTERFIKILKKHGVTEILKIQNVDGFDSSHYGQVSVQLV